MPIGAFLKIPFLGTGWSSRWDMVLGGSFVSMEWAKMSELAIGHGSMVGDGARIE